MVNYRIDSAHTAAQFKVRHMMIANVKGELGNITGSVQFDPASPESSAVEASIDVSTLNTREPDRDKHLKSEDFLDIVKYPTLTFKSKKVTPAGNNQYSVTGDLTIRGVTREVVLSVEEVTGETKDPWGAVRRGATARTRIRRKDFDMTFNVALEAGGFLVGDDVDIEIDAELIRED